jgi:hypothetical protein
MVKNLSFRKTEDEEETLQELMQFFNIKTETGVLRHLIKIAKKDYLKK